MAELAADDPVVKDVMRRMENGEYRVGVDRDNGETVIGLTISDDDEVLVFLPPGPASDAILAHAVELRKRFGPAF